MTEQAFVLKPPTEDTPGYVERLERAMDFKDAIDRKELTGATIRSLVEFLADYIDGDREQVKAAIRQASQREFTEMLNAVAGGTAQVPPVS